MSGLGTNTLTWTFSAITNATLSTTLAGTGANAIKDAAGNALAGGAGFSQAFSVLYGDFNGDGVVTRPIARRSAAIQQLYNMFADINGDGVVNTTDVTIERHRHGGDAALKQGLNWIHMKTNRNFLAGIDLRFWRHRNALLLSVPAKGDIVLSLESRYGAPGSTGNIFDVLLTNTGGSRSYHREASIVRYDHYRTPISRSRT